MLDHLPPARNDLQRLGDIFAQLRQACAAAARAGRRSENDQAFAWQVLREGLARRPLTGKGRHLGGLGRRTLCRQLVFRRRDLQLFELQLELME